MHDSNFKFSFTSNSSNGYFPENSTSSFRVKCADNFDFVDSMEVGLSQIHFPNKFLNIRSGYNKITVYRYKTMQGISIKQIKTIYLPSGFYKNVDDVVKFIKKSMQQYSFKQKIGDITKKVRAIDIDFNDNRVKLNIKRKFGIILGEDICQILGLSRLCSNVISKGEYVGENITNEQNPPSTIFIECDIIKQQYYADTKKQMIKAIFCPNKSDMTSYYFFPIEYYKLKKLHFESFAIKLFDEKNCLVKLDDGVIFMQLDFRKKL